MPAGLFHGRLWTRWAAGYADQVICNFDFQGGPNSSQPPPNVTLWLRPDRRSSAGDRRPDPQGRRNVHRAGHGVPQAQVRSFAVTVANQDYADYSTNFLSPSITLMAEVGLWIALEATIGFIVGLGLASLMGQRTVPIILLVILELVVVPIFSRHII